MRGSAVWLYRRAGAATHCSAPLIVTNVTAIQESHGLQERLAWNQDMLHSVKCTVLEGRVNEFRLAIDSVMRPQKVQNTYGFSVSTNHLNYWLTDNTVVYSS